MLASDASFVVSASHALFVQGDLDAVPDFFSPDYVVHVTGKDMRGGHGAVRAVVGKLLRAFSVRALEIDILVESTDRLAWQRTMRATHKGAFKGFPATGRSIVWRDMVVSRFAGGRIAEEWVVTDLAERLLLARKAGSASTTSQRKKPG